MCYKILLKFICKLFLQFTNFTHTSVVKLILKIIFSFYFISFIKFCFKKKDQLDIHTVADILKSFFRQLPDPIIPRVPFCSLLIQESSKN